MKDNGRIIREMEKEFILILMEMFIKEIGERMRKKAMEYISS